MPPHYVRKPTMMGAAAMPGGAPPQRVMIQRVPYPTGPGTVTIKRLSQLSLGVYSFRLYNSQYVYYRRLSSRDHGSTANSAASSTTNAAANAGRSAVRSASHAPAIPSHS